VTTPQRIQRRRTAGWRLPEGAVIVTRPTRWGNPYVVGAPGIPDAATATGRLAALIAMRSGSLAAGEVVAALPSYPSVEEIRAELAGRDLACWCRLPAPGEPDLCHAAVLLEISNSLEAS
jgi:uncharacterized protein DUF4326